MHSLLGTLVELRPLLRSDGDALVAAAADGDLWDLPYTVVPSRATVTDFIDAALRQRDEGTALPFVALLRSTGSVIGSTRFWRIDKINRSLEIGRTWFSASCHGTGVNTEAKYLMLRHAFEAMACVRVQLTTDVLNARSRAAILRLGAKEEGVIRHERIMPDGRKRDSVRFSIVDTEWPAVRANLQDRLANPASLS